MAADFFDRQPRGADDALIQRTRSFVAGDFPGERKAQIGRVGALLAILINAQQRSRPESISGFFQRFADRAFDQGFTRLQMAGRLIETVTEFGVLFNQQETPVAFEHRGDGNVGFPDRILG